MEHETCTRNYKTEPSKVMKASAALELILELHDWGVGVEIIVSDNDSTIRPQLHRIDTIKNGKLPLDISQPLFFCDPSRCIKYVVNNIFGLTLLSNLKLSKAPMEHLFACHEWCGAHWCYAVEINQAKNKYNECDVPLVEIVTSHLPRKNK